MTRLYRRSPRMNGSNNCAKIACHPQLLTTYQITQTAKEKESTSIAPNCEPTISVNPGARES
jgi:hypothetical protein